MPPPPSPRGPAALWATEQGRSGPTGGSAHEQQSGARRPRARDAAAAVAQRPGADGASAGAQPGGRRCRPRSGPLYRTYAAADADAAGPAARASAPAGSRPACRALGRAELALTPPVPSLVAHAWSARQHLAESDPYNIEVQRRLEEEIRQQNVNRSLEQALEHAPEMFGKVGSITGPRRAASRRDPVPSAHCLSPLPARGTRPRARANPGLHALHQLRSQRPQGQGVC